jgi:hypothetical protein
MRRVLDYDPLSKQTVYWDSDMANKKVSITHVQDVQHVLDAAHDMQMDEERTKNGIAQDMWHYAKVPSVVIMEMKEKHGVDFFDKNDWPRVFRLLNTEYSRFKTTHKTHEIKHAQ